MILSARDRTFRSARPKENMRVNMRQEPRDVPAWLECDIRRVSSG
jgi:hypothetical protein